MYGLPEQFSDLSPRRQRQIADFILSKSEEIKLEAMDDALRMLFAIPVLVLHDYFGFRTIRLTRFLNAMNTKVKSVNADPDAMAEIVETAQKEAGYVLETI